MPWSFYDSNGQVKSKSTVDYEFTAAELDDVGDVTITDAADENLLVRDTGAWVNKTPAEVAATMNVGDVGDVTITTVADDNVLMYDTDAWVNKTPADVLSAANVADIGDVTLTDEADGEVLVLDTGVWINKTLDEAGIAKEVVVSTADVSDPPTAAELAAALGAANTHAPGIVALINDNNAGTNYYLAVTDGTTWLTLALTIAL
jgi:hypothetical protein